MNKRLFEEYKNLLEERKDIKERLENARQELEDSLNTRSEDVVKGSSKTFPYTQHTMHISGIDEHLVTRKKLALEKLVAIYQTKEIEICEKSIEIEEYLEQIEDSVMRTIIRCRIIDDMSWVATALKVNMNETACKKKYYRMFK